MAARLAVEIVGDSRSLERAFRRSSKSATTFGRELGRIGGRTRGLFTGLAAQAGLAFGAVGLIGGIKSAIEGASDLNEQMGKTEIVFGDSSQAIIDWSQTTATAFGISRREALTTASSFGALFRPAGLGTKEAAEQSRRLTELGSDLAAFYNTDVADALKALQSGVVGQSRPLRRYGVLLSATRVNLEAMRETGKKTASSLTDQEKVQARLAIIYKDTALAQGNFALTSGNLAQQQKVLSANLSNIKDELGQALLPVVLNIVSAMNDWLGNTKNQHRVMDAFGTATAGVGRVAVTTYNILRSVVGALGGIGNALTILVGAWVGFRIAGVISATTVMAANLVAAGAVSSAWKAALVSTGWGAFAVAAGIAATYVVFHWQKVKIWFEEFLLWLAESFDKTALKIVEAFSHLPGRLGKPFRAAKDFLKADLAEIDRQAGELANKEAKLAGRPKGPRLPKVPPLPPLPAIPDIPDAVTAKTKKANKDAADARKKQRREDAAAAREKARQAARDRAERLRALREARQFRLLGFGPTGEELIPGVKTLRRQLGGIGKAIQGTFLDTRKTRGLMAHIRQVLSGGLGAVGSDVRSKIRDILADLRRQLKEHQGEQERFFKANPLALLGGLGLTPHQRRQLEVRMATVGPGGVVPRPSAQFAGAGAVNIYGGVHLHGVQDMQGLEQHLTKRQKQRQRIRRGAR